jgi:ethanolamine permease
MAPALLGKVHQRFHTPANALIANMLIGILALITGKTADIITIACFGAITLYIISMVSLIRLRQSEPDMPRPFKVPFYPISPILALGIAVVALMSMAWFNHRIALIYAGLLAASYIGYMVVYRRKG